MSKVRKEMVYTALAVLLVFFAVGYTSCKKTETTPTVDDGCANVVCQNGGTCFKGDCSCPVGYEGTYCQTKSASKYIGKWQVEEKVVVSSDNAKVGTTRNYTMEIVQTSSIVYELSINNFRGNAAYNNVGWRLGWQYITDDDGNELQTIALPTQFLFTRKQVLSGSRITIESGNGTVNNTGTFISGSFKTTEPDSTGKAYRETCEFSAVFIP